MTELASAHAAVKDAQRAAAAAAREHTDAAGLAADLEARIATGDLDIRAEELAAAKQLATFAHLRARGAEANAARAAEDHRQAQLAELAADLVAHDADVATFDAALTDLETALDKLGQLGQERAQTYRALADRARTLGLADGPPSRASRGIHLDSTTGHVSVGLGTSGRRIRPIDVAPYVATAVSRAANRHGWTHNGTHMANRLTELPHSGAGRLDLHDHLRRAVS